MGLGGEDDVGAEAADGVDQLAAEGAVVFELAVGVAEEDDVVDAEDAGGLVLLLLADAGQAVGLHLRVAGAVSAVGADDVGDPGAFPDPACDSTAAAAFGIVGVRRDDQGARGRCQGLHSMCPPVAGKERRMVTPSPKSPRELVAFRFVDPAATLIQSRGPVKHTQKGGAAP